MLETPTMIVGAMVGGSDTLYELETPTVIYARTVGVRDTLALACFRRG